MRTHWNITTNCFISLQLEVDITPHKAYIDRCVSVLIHVVSYSGPVKFLIFLFSCNLFQPWMLHYEWLTKIYCWADSVHWEFNIQGQASKVFQKFNSCCGWTKHPQSCLHVVVESSVTSRTSYQQDRGWETPCRPQGSFRFTGRYSCVWSAYQWNDTFFLNIIETSWGIYTENNRRLNNGHIIGEICRWWRNFLFSLYYPLKCSGSQPGGSGAPQGVSRWSGGVVRWPY